MARRFAHRLNAGFASWTRRGPGTARNVEVFDVIGDIAGRDAVIAGRFRRQQRHARSTAAVKLVERGARTVVAAVSHGLFFGRRSRPLAASSIERMIVTDTVENRRSRSASGSRSCAVAELFAEAIRRIHGHESISVLFRES